jgi:hypothetical protein
LSQVKNFVNKLLERVQKIESTVQLNEEEDYDLMMERKFAKLRAARAKKTDAFGGKTYEDVWDNISDKELDYFKGKWLELSPEESEENRIRREEAGSKAIHYAIFPPYIEANNIETSNKKKEV